MCAGRESRARQGKDEPHPERFQRSERWYRAQGNCGEMSSCRLVISKSVVSAASSKREPPGRSVCTYCEQLAPIPLFKEVEQFDCAGVTADVATASPIET